MLALVTPGPTRFDESATCPASFRETVEYALALVAKVTPVGVPGAAMPLSMTVVTEFAAKAIETPFEQMNRMISETRRSAVKKLGLAPEAVDVWVVKVCPRRELRMRISHRKYVRSDYRISVSECLP
jgi:hypothetical protein